MKYPVLRPLNHDQTAYRPGDEVELTKAQAEHLQSTNTVGQAIKQQSPKTNAETGNEERSGAADKAAPTSKSRHKTTKPKEE